MMKALTKTEEILLLAIWKLQDEAYGVKIRQHLSKVLQKEFTYGNLYSVLDQLVKKRYVTKTQGEPTPKRRGRSKIYYSISREGAQALKAAIEMNEAMWAGLSKHSFDAKIS